MAISIKNHEDRITALENSGFGDVLTPDYVNAVSITSPFTVDKTGYILISTNEKLANVCFLTINGIRLYSIQAFQDKYWSNLNSLVPVKPTDKVEFRVGYNISSTFMIAFIPAIKSVLKLYYNFSYNITREFYYVKFNKLKHYLCSHLRNYASNKGGVIQNGY